MWFGMPNLEDLVWSYLDEFSENDHDDQLLTEYSDYLSDEFRIGKQNTFEKARAVFEIFLRFIKLSKFPLCVFQVSDDAGN